MDAVWEEQISLHPAGELRFDVLPPAREHRAADAHPTDWSSEAAALDRALASDDDPLPRTEDREGYYGPHHFSYWMSGLRDCRLLYEAADRLGVEMRDYLDLGCASGRVVRHVNASGRGTKVYGCDINRRHVDWVSRHLSPDITVFQNHSVPQLPLPDSSVDAVTAYSVFTHIEVFDTTWLMELRRVLRPGGIVWATFQSDLTWEAMGPGWPIYDALSGMDDFAPHLQDRGPLPHERTVFRAARDRSYTSNVFYDRDYIRRTWARILPIAEEHHRFPDLQDVVIMQKER